MLLFAYTPKAITTLEGLVVSKASIIGYADACVAVGLPKPAIKLWFSVEIQAELAEKGIKPWQVANRVSESLGLPVRYDLARPPYVPAPKPVEAKPKGSRKPKAPAGSGV